MRKLLPLLIALCRLMVFASMMTMTGSVLVQVFCRAFLPQSPMWTEELTRYALLYTVAFGAGLSMLTGNLVNVDLFIELLPEKGRRIATALALLITSIFAALLIVPSYQYGQIGAFQTSPTLGIRMTWVFYTMLLLVVLLCLFSLVAAIRILVVLWQESLVGRGN